MTEVKSDIAEMKSDIKGLKESNKNIRRDILNLGDRFPSQFAFGELSNRSIYSREKSFK